MDPDRHLVRKRRPFPLVLDPAETWCPEPAKRIRSKRDGQLRGQASDHHQLGRLRHPRKNQPAWQSHRLGQRNLLDKISALLRAHRNSDNPRMRLIDREEVARRLTYDICISLVRDAMIAFSACETKQLLRSIIPLAGGHLFGIMPGALGANASFGAKLISIFPENAAQGRQSHQGLIVLFEPDSGTPVCVVHAGEVTAIRTAAASAVATDALARQDAKHLAILGTGEQAATHARAISKVRALESITVWGRSFECAHTFADKMHAELGIPITSANTVQQAVANADIVCTV